MLPPCWIEAFRTLAPVGLPFSIEDLNVREEEAILYYHHTSFEQTDWAAAQVDRILPAID